MARPLRIEFAGAMYHITSRGNERREIFFDDGDCRAFLATLERTIARFGWECLAYCLMVNHYHLVLRTPEPNLSRGMKYLNSVYVQGLNRRHDRVGRLLDNRYKTRLVLTEDHILNTIRYVAWNPVESELCDSPGDWPWSSHAAVLDLRRTEIVNMAALLRYFGDEHASARAVYADFVRVRSDWQPPDDVVDPNAPGRTELLAERPPSEIPRHFWRSTCPPLSEVLRTSDIATAVAAAYRRYGYTMNEIARELGCHRSTVSRILRRAEI